MAGSRRVGSRGVTLPPGPRGIPLLGNVVQFRRDQLGFLLHLQRTYGGMATIAIGRTPVVVLFRPEHVRYVLTQQPENFTNREVAGGLVFGNMLMLSLLARSLGNRVTQGLQDLVGDGLLTTDGDIHDRHRQLLQAALTRPRVERHGDLIVRYTREVVDAWHGGAEMDLEHDVQALTLRIITKVLLDFDVRGTRVGRLIEGVLEQPVGLVETILNARIELPFTAYGRRLALLHEADQFVYDLIDRRRAEGRDAGDILSVMLATPEEGGAVALTRKEVRDELVSLVAAGYETTTNSVLWTLHLLAEHPQVLERVQGELRSVLAGRDAAADSVGQLTYLDWVIKESMRVYPSAWTQGRRAVAAFDLDGYHFPAGTLLMFSQWVLHRLPDVWQDPEVFRPERWDPAHGQDLPHWAYFPFGVGPRTCVGMSLAYLQVRLVIATIVQRFGLEPVPGKQVKPFPLITLRLRPGLRVRLVPCPDDHHAVRQSSGNVEPVTANPPASVKRPGRHEGNA